MATILIAPDSLKGSLSAVDAAKSLERGARRALGEQITCFLVPLADGGEGTVEAVLRGAGGTLQQTKVRGPLDETVLAEWAILNDGRAVLEMAQASGLTLVPLRKTRCFARFQLWHRRIDFGRAQCRLPQNYARHRRLGHNRWRQWRIASFRRAIS